MESPAELYSHFLRALRFFVSQKGQKFFALETGKSEAWISKILKDGSKQRASFDLQVTLANSVGLKYEQFIETGRKLGSLIQIGEISDMDFHKRYEQLIIENHELRKNIKTLKEDKLDLIESIMMITKPPEGISERRACAAKIGMILNKNN